MEVVEEKARARIVQDITYGDSREKGERGPVNETTEWSRTPECELAEVMNDIVKRILGLQTKFGTGRKSLIKTMDAKSSFGRLGRTQQERRLSGT